MDRSARILTGTIVAFLIITLGLALGLYLSFKQPQRTTIPVAEKAEPPGPNNNIYDISPPSRGSVPQTFTIDITPLGNAAIVTLPAARATDIKTGQKVLLYDNENVLLETVGEVTNVIENKDNGLTIVHLGLNGDEIVSANNVARGKIVTGVRNGMERIPPSALIRNEKGQTYVWEAQEDQDGTYSAHLKQINVITAAPLFAAIEPLERTSGVYIMNPDEKLRDGQKINIAKNLYPGPGPSDDVKMERIMTARQERLRQERDSRVNALRDQRLLDAPTAKDGGNGAGGCPVPDDLAARFMDKIKNLGDAAKAVNAGASP